MYVVVSVGGCSYFVVRQMRYEVAADFLGCKNHKDSVFVLKSAPVIKLTFQEFIIFQR